MKRILTFLAAAVCFCACEKEQEHWLSPIWHGEYEAIVQNNDTGEYRTVTASIILEFSDDRSECIVRGAYSGLHSMYSKRYYATVYDKTRFISLREYPGDSEIVYVSETVSGGRILKWRTGDEETVITIKAMKLE